MFRTIFAPLVATVQQNPWVGFVVLGLVLIWHTDHTANAVAALQATDKAKADTVQVQAVTKAVTELRKETKDGFCFLSKGTMPGCALYIRRVP